MAESRSDKLYDFELYELLIDLNMYTRMVKQRLSMDFQWCLAHSVDFVY